MNNGAWRSMVVLAGALLAARDGGASTDASLIKTAAMGTPLAVSTNTIRVLHQSIRVDAEFERFTKALEKLLGHFPEGVQQDFIERPTLAAQRVKAAEGAQELMVFSVFDHGAALNMLGARRNAKQYLIGNALTAIKMTHHDIRAALYAPLRVIVYEPRAGQTIVEYDQPSSLFGQFAQEEVTRVALTLDSQLEQVIAEAAAASSP